MDEGWKVLGQKAWKDHQKWLGKFEVDPSPNLLPQMYEKYTEQLMDYQDVYSKQHDIDLRKELEAYLQAQKAGAQKAREHEDSLESVIDSVVKELKA